MLSNAAQAYLETRQPWVSDWPFVRPGVVMTYLGPHFLMLLDDGVTPRIFDEYMEQLERVCGSTPRDFRGSVTFHLRPSAWWETLSLREKTQRIKLFADLLARHETDLKKVVPLSVSVTHSLLARVAQRTIDAVRTPAVPRSVVSTAEAGWSAVQRHFPELDCGAVLEAHAELVARHVPGLAESLFRVARATDSRRRPEA
jgi:hypothetical protein